MTKKATLSLVYLSLFAILGIYFARDAGWLREGPLYWSVLYAGSIVLLAAVLWIARLRASRDGLRDENFDDLTTERVFMGLGALAIVALIVVGIARAMGHLQNHNLFITLNICLPLFALMMAYQIYLRRKRKTHVT